MSQIFKILYQWENREEPGYYNAWVDVEQIYNSLKFFLTKYAGEFQICVDNDLTYLDLSPDLSTIFKHIPTVLETLEKNENIPVMFYFFEEGTMLKMWMERQGEYISVRFDIAPGTSLNHAHMPQEDVLVPAHEFLSEWAKFIQDILQAILQIQPELAEEESFITYSSRINAVSSYATELGSRAVDSSTKDADSTNSQQTLNRQSELLSDQQCTVEYYWEELETKNAISENPDEDVLTHRLRSFIAHHKGQILGNMGGERFCLDLKKDLQAVFKSLPSALMKLTNDTDDLIKLDISENDLALFLSRKGDEISALFAIPSRTEEGYKVLSDRPNVMSAHRFLEQWTRFVRAILSELTQQTPTLIKDKSYQDYVNKIILVEEAISSFLVAS
jgi:hypothetical protein